MSPHLTSPPGREPSWTSTRSALSVLTRTAVIVAAVETGIMSLLSLLSLPVQLNNVLDPVVLTAVTAPLVYLWVVRPLFEQLRRYHRDAAAQADRREFEARLRRAFDMTLDENHAVETIGHALNLLVPAGQAELLLADSSQAHLLPIVTAGRRADAAGTANGTGEPSAAEPVAAHCTVGTPGACPAVNTGTTRIFPHADALDACRHLRTRSHLTRSAACLPITSMGHPLGVLHITTAETDSFDGETMARLETLAGLAGPGIGLRRSLERTQRQADTDGLTGLSNRRSLLDQAARRLPRCTGYSAVMIDLDNFKKLNDAHGHHAGDQAIRTTAAVLRRQLRDGDLLGRYGGEEFLALLPDATAEQGAQIAERIRTSLIVAAATRDTLMTTASFGVADSTQGTGLDEVIQLADRALLAAKRAGRNQVHVHGQAATPAAAGQPAPSRPAGYDG